MKIEILSKVGNITLNFIQSPEEGEKMIKAITNLLDGTNNGVINYHDNSDHLIFSKEFLQQCLIRIPKNKTQAEGENFRRTLKYAK